MLRLFAFDDNRLTHLRLWLCDLEMESPGLHQLHGFDISSDCFISPKHLPKSVQLKLLDATKPLPAELRGQFDVVHIRLLQSIILDNDPSNIICHCKELLRPGGYVQWEEFDPAAVDLHDHNGKAQNLQKLRNMLQDRAPARSVGKC